MKGRSALELGIYSENGRPVLLKFRRPRWSLCPIVLCVAYGITVMQIGVVWTLGGPPVVFCSYEKIKGWWRELKSTWVSTRLPFLSKLSKTNLLGL